MINSLPQDAKEREKLVNLTLKAVKSSIDYFDTKRAEAVRAWKIWYRYKDEEPDNDEPNDFLSYAFGMIEEGVSKVTEPILQTNPPCKARPPLPGMQDRADKFNSIAKQYYESSENQTDYTISNKDLLVTGNRWEFFEWAAEYAKGKRWQEVAHSGVLSRIADMAGKVLPINPEKFQYKSMEEVEYDYPVRVGFRTIYPNFLDVFPEPGPKKFKDLSWIVRQERELSVEWMKKQLYVDPQTGEKRPRYDLTELLADAGDHEPGAIKPHVPSQSDDKGDYSAMLMDITRSEDEGSRTYVEDKVHLLIFYDWAHNRRWEVAQGKYLVSCFDEILHCPLPNAVLTVYTPDPNCLYGYGMIIPVEAELNELNDTHNLSFANFIRMVHKMLAYREDAIVTEDDFKPRAGGKVRVKGPFSPSEVFYPLDQMDSTSSILAMQSNIKGLLEKGASLSDFSPGTEGTKQYHKTAYGLSEITKALAMRFTTVRRLMLAAQQYKLMIMQMMFTQFQFDPIPVPHAGPEGGVTIIDMTRDDIDTGGVPFNFPIEQDPAFGDDAIARNQSMVFFDRAVIYEEFRMKYKPDLREAKIDEIFEKMSKSFGYYDETAILQQPSGVLPASAEINLMNQGIPVQPNPKEDLAKHLKEHTLFIQSPEYQKARETDKITPEIDLLHKSHIEATAMLLGDILNNPAQAAIEDKNQSETNRARMIEPEKQSLLPAPQEQVSAQEVS